MLRAVQFIIAMAVLASAMPLRGDWAQLQRANIEYYLGELPLPNPEQPDEVLVQDTMQMLGSLATALFVRGQRAGSTGGPALMAGSTIVDAMPAIRSSLLLLLEPLNVKDERQSARDSLARFDRAARRQLASLAMPDEGELDVQLESIFMPLRAAIGHLELRPPPSGWWMEPSASTPASDAVVELDVIIESADWLAPSQRTLIREQLDEARSILSPMELQQRTRPLVRMADAIAAIREQPGGRTFAKRRAATFLETIESSPGVLPSAASATELARAIERSLAYQHHEMGDLPHALRTLHVRLSELYELADRKLFEQSLQILASPAPRADPSLVAAIVDQRDGLDALQLLGHVSDQVELARSIHPGSAEGVMRQQRKMARDLLSPQHREDAMRALRAMSWQTNAFGVLPLESRIANGEPVLSDLLAQRTVELGDRISALRTVWVGEWSRGDILGEGAIGLALVHRLLGLAEVALDLTALDSLESQLQPWSAWFLPAGRLDRWQQDMRLRLRIAATALVSGDDEEAVDQLDRLESELAMLRLAHLLIQMAPDIPSASPAGAALGQLAFAPEEQAWLVDYRREFAALARLAMEAEAARQEERFEEIDAIQQALSGRAEALYRVLAGPEHVLIPVPGFDGSNPDPHLSPLRLEVDRRR
ncbi:MAG: hypothetical protein MK095_03955 [Phycisphaerales bacterium]|nr:hypothetical protein [Phycisphaerales bacterium]